MSQNWGNPNPNLVYFSIVSLLEMESISYPRPPAEHVCLKHFFRSSARIQLSSSFEWYQCQPAEVRVHQRFQHQNCTLFHVRQMSGMSVGKVLAHQQLIGARKKKISGPPLCKLPSRDWKDDWGLEYSPSKWHTYCVSLPASFPKMVGGYGVDDMEPILPLLTYLFPKARHKNSQLGIVQKDRQLCCDLVYFPHGCIV